ncbi:sulfotransferase family protein [Gracilimonas sp.]|uniref:sulfotransferase family protein n=1 Tax=Gracilimonas sp. TaxID=1974203 RepID=UPI0028719533|nr:sulfotransferase [Gracilimonas sp.]
MTFYQILKSFYQANKAHYQNLKEQRNLATLKESDASEVYEKVHQKAAPTFVLSTGRCGTKLLTNIFATHEGIKVYHNPHPEFTWHTKYAFEHQSNRSEIVKMMFDVARYELIRNAYINNNIFIETNNRVTFFAHQIAKLYPNAKFIHLIRQPVDFVKSGMVRNWYSEQDIYDEGRIKDVENPESWESYSVEEKIAWLWKSTNDFIETFKEDHEVLTITSEDLFSNTKSVRQLLEFLELPSIPLSTLKKYLSNPVNESKKEIFLTTAQIQSIKDITDK